MKDLRVVGRTEDGTQIELADGDGQTFFVRISDNLKALVNQPRLVSVTPYEDRATYSVKEIQSRLRSGESAAAISTTTDWSLEKIEKFSGPIMQERAYVIGLALQTQLRRDSSAPTLATATIAQLQPRGVDMSEVDWNTHRNDDATWTIVLQYPTSDGRGSAEANWIFDSDNRTLVADDDGARWISGDEKPLRPNTPSHGMVFGGEQSAPAPRLTAYSESVTVIENVSLSVVPDHEVSEDKNEDKDKDKDEDQEIQETPTESIPSDAKKDGVTKRIRIPSWDDIMFGTKKDDPTE
jgi:hypothetical protein